MRQRFPYLTFFSLFLPFLVLYRYTTCQLFSFDAITNAIACETNEPVRWFHSNHPLYPFLGVVWYRLEKFAGYQGLSIYSLARFNTFLMASALGLFAVTVSEKIGREAAIFLSFLLGMTYAVWQFAVDGRAVGASVFFSVLLIARLLALYKKEGWTYSDPLLLGVLSALLTLTHAIAVFHCAPLALWIFFRGRDWRFAATYAFAAGLLIFAAYFGIHTLVIRPGANSSLLQWALGYAAFDGTSHVMQSGFWVKNGVDFFQGAWGGWRRAFFSTAPSSPLNGAANAGAVLILLGFLSVFYRIRLLPRREKELAAALIAWGGLVALFLLFWSPGQEGFRLHVIVPWFAVATLVLSRGKALSWALFAGAAVLFYWNFTFAIFPASFIQNNTGYQILTTAERHMKPGDVLLTAQSAAVPQIEVLLPYFFPQFSGGSVNGRLMAFRETSLDPLYARLTVKAAQGAELYFADDLFDATVQRNVERERNLTAGALAQFVSKFQPLDFVALMNGRQLYRVKVKA